MKKTDVVIVGGSLAGCTAAVLYARAGLEVTLVERQASMTAFKSICGHLIQAGANGVLEELGLDEEIAAAGGIRSGLQLWTAAGWLRPTEVTPDRDRPFNIRREKLDPMVRALAERTPGVTLKLGYSARSLLKSEDGAFAGVEVEGPGGELLRIEARLVVGADGRNSRIAQLAEVPVEKKQNVRCMYGGYFRGIDLPTKHEGQFWLLDDVVFTFPTDDGITLLAVMPRKERAAEFKKDMLGTLKRYYAGLPNAPSLEKAVMISDTKAMLDMPNLYRGPIAKGLALIGDAACASDPVWGVGCGWAFQSAQWLVDSTARALTEGGNLQKALEGYRRVHKRKLYPLHTQNTIFSMGQQLPTPQRIMLTAGARNPAVAHVLGRLLGGQISPLRFLLTALPLALVTNLAYQLRALLSARPALPAGVQG